MTTFPKVQTASTNFGSKLFVTQIAKSWALFAILNRKVVDTRWSRHPARTPSSLGGPPMNNRSCREVVLGPQPGIFFGSCCSIFNPARISAENGSNRAFKLSAKPARLITILTGSKYLA